MKERIGNQKVQIRVGVNKENEILYYHEICNNNSTSITPDAVALDDDEYAAKEIEMEIPIKDLYDSKTLYKKIQRKFKNRK